MNVDRRRDAPRPPTRHPGGGGTGSPRRLLVFVTTAVLSGLGIAAPGGESVRVRALVSQDVGPYRETLAGFEAAIRRAAPGAVVEVVALDGDTARAEQAAKEARADGVDLVLALGSPATRAATGEAPDIPVVAGLILRSDEIPVGANATGVVLEFPAEIELRYLQKMLPGQRSIGVLYGAPGTAARIDAATRAASTLGLKLHVHRLASPRDLPDALERIAREADVLWGIADELVFNPQTARPILLFSMRNRLPLVGLSEGWVKAGALYALERDYADIGAQCADLAAKILRGVAARSLPPVPPRKTLHFVNSTTARHLKVALDGPLVREARTVIE